MRIEINDLTFLELDDDGNSTLGQFIDGQGVSEIYLDKAERSALLWALLGEIEDFPPDPIAYEDFLKTVDSNTPLLEQMYNLRQQLDQVAWNRDWWMRRAERDVWSLLEEMAGEVVVEDAVTDCGYRYKRFFFGGISWCKLYAEGGLVKAPRNPVEGEGVLAFSACLARAIQEQRKREAGAQDA